MTEVSQCYDYISVYKTLIKFTELIDPANLCVVYVSPRERAHKTFHLLFDHLPKLPEHVMTEEVREWDYGDYEGLKSSEIHKTRPGWDIWNDGCVRLASWLSLSC